MEAKSWKIAPGGSPVCELRSLHVFFDVFIDFVCFQTLKDRCFLWKVLQIWGFCNFCCFLSLCLLRPHFRLIFAPFLSSKIVRNPSQRGFGKMMIFGWLFFPDFDDFRVPWGVPGVPPGAPFSLNFCTFGGPGGKFAPARPRWSQFEWVLTIWNVFRYVFCIF